MIPKFIHQTWESHDLPPFFQNIQKQWQSLNYGYKYRFYDKQDRLDTIIAVSKLKGVDPDLVDAYLNIVAGAFQADLWRYCILYLEGGFYFDLGTYPIGSINNFVENNTEYLFVIDLNKQKKEGEHNLANGFIGCIPRSNLMLNCINRVVENVRNKMMNGSILDFSGPGVLGRMCNQMLQRDEESSFIGKEGSIANLIFLHFDQFNKKVSRIDNGYVLLRGKNDDELKHKYVKLCERDNVIPWYCPKRFHS